MAKGIRVDSRYLYLIDIVSTEWWGSDAGCLLKFVKTTLADLELD